MAGRDRQTLDQIVEQYLTEAGWETDREEITRGVYRVAGLEPDTSRRQLVLVVPAASASLTAEDIEWLADRAENVGADIVEATTLGTVTDEARERAEEHDVTVQDPDTYRTAEQQPGQDSDQNAQPTQQPSQQQPQQSPESSGQASGQQPSQGGRGPQSEQQQTGDSGPPQDARQPRQQSHGSGQPQQPQQSGQQPRQSGQQPQQTQRQPNQPQRTGSATAGSSSDIADLLMRGFRPVGGFVYGLLGFLLALILTTAYYFYRLDQITNGNINIDEPQELGWAFYNAHMVDITASAGGTTVQSFNALDTIDQLNAVVFYAIVAVMLLIAGYSAASRVTGPLSGVEGVVAGASVVIGYLPLLAAGTFLFTIQETGGSVGPELGGTLVIWGAIFSLVFGAVGGFLSSLPS